MRKKSLINQVQVYLTYMYTFTSPWSSLHDGEKKKQTLITLLDQYIQILWLWVAEDLSLWGTNCLCTLYGRNILIVCLITNRSVSQIFSEPLTLFYVNNWWGHLKTAMYLQGQTGQVSEEFNKYLLRTCETSNKYFDGMTDRRSNWITDGYMPHRKWMEMVTKDTVLDW